MTNYWAGKLRLGPKLTEAMMDFIVRLAPCVDFAGYAELFVGMGGVLQHMIPALCDTRNIANRQQQFHFLAADVNARVMEFWKQLQKGWLPPTTVSHNEYVHLKKTAPDSLTALHTFVGYSCGFHGCYFRGNAPADRVDTRIRRGRANVMRARSAILGMPLKFECADFFDSFDADILPHDFIYYLDPPYNATLNDTGAVSRCRKLPPAFDTDRFWKCAAALSRHSLVFVSEMNAPREWIPIWQQTWKHTHNGKGYSRVEKLFVHHTAMEVAKHCSKQQRK